MKKLLTIIPVLFILIGATILFERPAYAYADPGTGLLAVQALGSALVATGWYLRRKIYSFLHRSSSGNQGPIDNPAQNDRGSSLS